MGRRSRVLETPYWAGYRKVGEAPEKKNKKQKNEKEEEEKKEKEE